MFEFGDILNDLFLERLNYLIYVVLLMIGLHAMIAKNNLIKKLIGMSIFQTAIILFYVSIGVKEDATIPIYLPEHDPHGEHAHSAGGPQALSRGQVATYANPLPHVLMLTAIVVGVATLGLALAVCQRIYQGYGTIEEDELLVKLEREDGRTRKAELPTSEESKRETGKRSTKPGKPKK
jgi:multicomponent Na+:H+ antiporter subunit C